MSLMQRCFVPLFQQFSRLSISSSRCQGSVPKRAVQHVRHGDFFTNIRQLSQCTVAEPLCRSTVPVKLSSRCMATLRSMHKSGPRWKKKKKESLVLDGCPQKRGVVLKVMIKKPKKPNSANRKCVRLRLTNGKEATAYVPGEGHNLQEHSIVLVRGGRVQDIPGVKIKCVRGKYDLGQVKKKAVTA